jgi:hypothetical protein
VLDVRIIYDRNTPKSKGMAYIEMALQTDIPACLSLTGQMLKGQVVMVKASEAEKNVAWCVPASRPPSPLHSRIPSETPSQANTPLARLTCGGGAARRRSRSRTGGRVDSSRLFVRSSSRAPYPLIAACALSREASLLTHPAPAALATQGGGATAEGEPGRGCLRHDGHDGAVHGPVQARRVWRAPQRAGD